MSRTPDDLIEIYVADVVRNLMPKQRTDVALELRALLHEELQEKARAAGRLPDEAMTVEYLRNFGRPAEVAARYHMPVTLIEPADTPAFLFFSIIGVSIASLLPYLQRLRGQEVVIRDWPEALWVVGLMVIIFAANGYVRRRWPQQNAWKPHRLYRNDASPAKTLFAIGFGIISLLVYAFPGQACELFRVNKLYPALNAAAFTFTDEFQSWRFPWLFLLAAPIFGFNIYALVIGRWTKVVRWLEIIFTLSLAIQLGWHAHIGGIVIEERADNLMRAVFMVAELVIFIQAGIRAWREWGRIDPPAAFDGASQQSRA